MKMHILTCFLTLIIIASASAQGTPDLPYDVAPWPVGDSLKMPRFPEMAKLAGVQGEVRIVVLVGTDSSAFLTDVLYEKPTDLGFRQEVEKVTDDWSFIPATRNGIPVSAYTYLRFEFKFAKDSLSARDPWPYGRKRRTLHPLFMFEPPPVFHVYPAIKRDGLHH